MGTCDMCHSLQKTARAQLLFSGARARNCCTNVRTSTCSIRSSMLRVCAVKYCSQGTQEQCSPLDIAPVESPQLMHVWGWKMIARAPYYAPSFAAHLNHPWPARCALIPCRRPLSLLSVERTSSPLRGVAVVVIFCIPGIYEQRGPLSRRTCTLTAERRAAAGGSAVWQVQRQRQGEKKG